MIARLDEHPAHGNLLVRTVVSILSQADSLLESEVVREGTVISRSTLGSEDAKHSVVYNTELLVIL